MGRKLALFLYSGVLLYADEGHVGNHQLYYLLLLGFGLLIVAFYGWNQKLKKKVLEQTSALNERNLQLEEVVKEALQEKHKMEEAGNQLFHLSLHLLLIAGFDGKIHRVNPGWMENLGYEEEELVGTSFFDLVHPDDLDRTVKEAQQIGEGKKTIYFKNRYRHKDGSYRTLEWSAIDVPSQNVLYAIAQDVTKQEETQHSLEIANTTLRSAQNISRVGYWSYIPESGKVIWSDEVFALMDRDLSLGVPSVEEQKTMVHEDDWERYLGVINDALEKGIPYKETIRFFTSKDTVRYIYNSGYIKRDESGKIVELYGTAQDITSFKQLELDLLKKTAAFETVILEAPNPMALHNESGEILILNKAWEEISGYSVKEVPTRDTWVEAVYPKEKHEEIKKHNKTLYDLVSSTDEGEFTLYAKNGEKRIWRFSSAPVGIMNGQKTIISSAMDMTEIREKDELMIVQSKQAAMGEMIAMIAHQWRQPLALISMSSNNILLDIELEQTLDPQETKRYAQRINEQSAYLSQTVDDFRNFFKNDKEFTAVTPKMIFEGALALIEKSLTYHEINVQMHLIDNSTLMMPYNDMIQVIVNLINNAKDALVESSIKEPSIELIAQKEGEYLALHVKDNGTGVPESVISKIFDPYFSTKSLNGTGLGLYICKSIIEKHMHGQVMYQKSTQGADFVVLLPLKEGT